MNNCLDHQIGIVKEINDGKVFLAFQRSEACGKCGACGVLTKTHEMVMTIPDDDYHVGDKVLVSIETRYFMLSAFLLYVVPLIGLLAGIIISSALGAEQIISAIIGLVSAAVLLVLLRLFKNRFEAMKSTSIKFIKMD